MGEIEFNKRIGDILFDGYYEGGAGGNPKARKSSKGSKPKDYDYAAKYFDYLLGKIKRNVVMVDYDDPGAFNARLRISKALEQHCIVIKSPNKGGHFYWFNNEQKLKTNTTKNRTFLTLAPVDYKCGIKAWGDKIIDSDLYGALSNDEEGSRRKVVYCNLKNDNELDEIPFYDLPLGSEKDNKYDFLGMVSGDGRNDVIFSFMNKVKAAGYSYENYLEIIELTNQYLFSESMPAEELKIVTRREKWESAASSFGTGSSFKHDEFGMHMISKYHICKINGKLHIYDKGVYIPGNDKIEQAMIKEFISIKKRARSEVLSFIDLMCEDKQISKYDLIAFNNGIYDVTNNTLIPFTPDIIITNKIPCNYNPNAKSELIDTVLNNLSCNDPSIRALLEEVAGACLYRSNTLAGGRMPILVGDKNNGKSTYFCILMNMLGSSNYSALDLKDVGDRFKSSMMFGKLANLGDDIEDEYIRDTSTMKKLVTGEPITAERKGQDPFVFKPYCKMIFSANNMPRINDPTGAMQRRLLQIPLNASFSKSDPDYDPHIQYKLESSECIEYMILLAIEGLNRLLKNKNYTSCSASEKIMSEYEVINNPVKAFMSDADIEHDIMNEPTQTVYLSYKAYCIENNLQPLSKQNFCKRMRKEYRLDIKVKKIQGKSIKIFVVTDNE